ncbi:molecular chaperone [Pseudomonas sp. S1Bt30]|uniref:Molecular chaperone n=1 Tax=Pseudomonas quebecensis TaxID=2995174 RepID=A0ABY6QLF5_9PSED|nr:MULTISPECIES: molecular chaperone [Pseudomonas]MCX4067613.1 molecular chaperone [Pseudomonas quebecensis]UZW20812.1 molecular chaperone [Pseudomonas quebecensis]UZW21771.1 molecular chaperone [Pseudomonas quebecensis]UZW26830.1 molecular chaperone [Pseudomonas quebecensis]
MHPTSFVNAHRLFTRLVLAMLASAPLLANAAVVPDRTRLVFEESAPSVSVTLSNKNPQLPFVVQSWIENEAGQKVTAPFMVLPPLQRMEANESSILRIVKLPELGLPKDRESVFYLNVREIPPKTEVVNAMQIALQSKIKLFYRPALVKRERGEDLALRLNVKIDSAGKQLLLDNPSPFHITVVGLLTGEEKTSVPLPATMIAPFSGARFALANTSFKTLRISNMNDFGGQSDTLFKCAGETCTGVKP